MNTLGTITYQQSHEIGEVMREQKEDLIRLGTNCVIIVFMLFFIKVPILHPLYNFTENHSRLYSISIYITTPYTYSTFVAVRIQRERERKKKYRDMSWQVDWSEISDMCALVHAIEAATKALFPVFPRQIIYTHNVYLVLSQ